jgi:hypothetical protein
MIESNFFYGVTMGIQNLSQVELLGEHHIESWPEQLKPISYIMKLGNEQCIQTFYSRFITPKFFILARQH